MTIIAIAWFIAAYLAGSIPTAYLVTKYVKGVDIRTQGSGNPGATNVFRVAGAGAGIVTFIVDILKGYGPVALASLWNASPAFRIIAGLCALCGHLWPVFLGFKGGKGVATGAGVFFALLPVPTALAFAVFVLIFGATGYVSLGSMLAALTMPAAAYVRREPDLLIIFALSVAAGIIYKHKTNIRRLMDGTERKTRFFKKNAGSPSGGAPHE